MCVGAKSADASTNEKTKQKKRKSDNNESEQKNYKTMKEEDGNERVMTKS